MKKKILYICPYLISIGIAYSLFEAIIEFFQGILEVDLLICFFLLPVIIIYGFLLIAEYFVIIKKSKMFALVLTILFALYSLVMIMELVLIILGCFGMILKTPGYESIGDFIQVSLFILFFILCTVSHYFLSKQFKKNHNKVLSSNHTSANNG